MAARVDAPARYRQQELKIALDVSALDAHGRAQWLALIDFASQVLGRGASISGFSASPPDKDEDFAYVTDSASLSRKLWLNLSSIYIQPREAPGEVDAFLYWKSREQSDRANAWRPATRVITLISSVFRADEFLPGFLENCNSLQGYPDCEHFLIRAGSPGSEHDRLIEHVRRCPSAVYLNLANDPGLYEVWNFGARLARGRYLSNANIDDRRAPEHLTHLQAILDSHPEIDVASTALRVTKERNTPWQNSESCTVWFADLGDLRVAVDGLFKATPSGLGSRNLPNCMPLWRRSLHARLGWFDEKRYGPSADWAFWVRAGMQGSTFYLSDEPLGLYLRDEESYWHRDPANREADQRIVAEYLAWADAGADRTSTPLPRSRTLSREIGDALDLLRSGAAHQGLGALLRLSSHGDEVGSTERALMSRGAEQFLGCAEFPQLVSNNEAACRSGRLGDVVQFNAWVDLMHATESTSAKSRRALELACIDLSECFGDIRGLLLLALAARKAGEHAFERQLLRQLHRFDSAAFWRTLQQVYRFTVPLPTLCEAVSDVAPRFASERMNVEHHVVFYPNSTGNAYQELLYRPIRESGGLVWGTSDAEAFLNAAIQPGAENVLHIHWINRLFRSADVEANKRDAAQFLEGVQRQKQAGFKIFWTIHNYLSHESGNAEAEIGFRQALYRLCDRVFIHHPLAAALLDWLPDCAKLCLCEHGHYEFALANNISRVEARARLGLKETDFVVAHLGQMRDYKGLDAALPALLEQLDSNPCMKVVIGGRIVSSGLRSWLNAHPHKNLIVHDRYLSDDELHCQMAAADFGLLSYSAILTSGSLVHWLSAGRPVLAPMVGTIPAYVVEGWNGYVYRDAESLGRLIHDCAQLPPREWNRLSDNARTTAQQMEWRMWAS